MQRQTHSDEVQRQKQPREWRGSAREGRLGATEFSMPPDVSLDAPGYIPADVLLSFEAGKPSATAEKPRRSKRALKKGVSQREHAPSGVPGGPASPERDRGEDWARRAAHLAPLLYPEYLPDESHAGRGGGADVVRADSRSALRGAKIPYAQNPHAPDHGRGHLDHRIAGEDRRRGVIPGESGGRDGGQSRGGRRSRPTEEGIAGCAPGVPEEFLCPLTRSLMADPVIIASGYSFERSAVQQWFESGQRCCPNTREPLEHCHVYPNVALRAAVHRWCAEHGADSGTAASGVALAVDRSGGGSQGRSMRRSMTDDQERQGTELHEGMERPAPIPPCSLTDKARLLAAANRGLPAASGSVDGGALGPSSSLPRASSNSLAPRSPSFGTGAGQGFGNCAGQTPTEAQAHSPVPWGELSGCEGLRSLDCQDGASLAPPPASASAFASASASGSGSASASASASPLARASGIASSRSRKSGTRPEQGSLERANLNSGGTHKLQSSGGSIKMTRRERDRMLAALAAQQEELQQAMLLQHAPPAHSGAPEAYQGHSQPLRAQGRTESVGSWGRSLSMWRAGDVVRPNAMWSPVAFSGNMVMACGDSAMGPMPHVPSKSSTGSSAMEDSSETWATLRGFHNARPAWANGGMTRGGDSGDGDGGFSTGHAGPQAPNAGQIRGQRGLERTASVPSNWMDAVDASPNVPSPASAAPEPSQLQSPLEPPSVHGRTRFQQEASTGADQVLQQVSPGANQGPQATLHERRGRELAFSGDICREASSWGLPVQHGGRGLLAAGGKGGSEQERRTPGVLAEGAAAVSAMGSCQLEGGSSCEDPERQGAGGGWVRTEMDKWVDAVRLGTADERRAGAKEIKTAVKASAESRERLMRADGIGPLVGALASDDQELVEHAMMTLMHLALHGDACPDIVRAGGIPLAVRVLCAGTPAARGYAAALLFAASSGKASRAHVWHAGAIPPLVNLLSAGTLRSKKDAALALYALCESGRCAREIINAGAVEILMGLIEETDSGTEEKAVALLANLCRYAEGCKAAADEGALTKMVDLLDEGSTMRVKEDAAAILLQMCESHCITHAELLKEGVLPSLVLIAQTSTSTSEAKTLLEVLRKKSTERLTHRTPK